MQTLSKRGACDTRSSGIILLAVTLAAGQVQFTRHLPQELGIDTVFSYVANSFVDYDGDGRPTRSRNRKYGGNTYDTNYVLVYRNESPPGWTLRNVAETLGLGCRDTIFDRDLVDPCWFDADGRVTRPNSGSQAAPQRQLPASGASPQTERLIVY